MLMLLVRAKLMLESPQRAQAAVWKHVGRLAEALRRGV